MKHTLNNRECVSRDINLKLFIIKIITNALCDETLAALDEGTLYMVEIMIVIGTFQHVSYCRIVSVTDVETTCVRGLVLSGV